MNVSLWMASTKSASLGLSGFSYTTGKKPGPAGSRPVILRIEEHNELDSRRQTMRWTLTFRLCISGSRSDKLRVPWYRKNARQSCARDSGIVSGPSLCRRVWAKRDQIAARCLKCESSRRCRGQANNHSSPAPANCGRLASSKLEWYSRTPPRLGFVTSPRRRERWGVWHWIVDGSAFVSRREANIDWSLLSPVCARRKKVKLFSNFKFPSHSLLTHGRA